jgi:hypothetical protein
VLAELAGVDEQALAAMDLGTTAGPGGIEEDEGENVSSPPA